ncbi:nicotinate phosphoribosyltransferase [Estrella lausannensis]|uniref:Nicotinate phosphoribosyltransferase n=1 Tax=Estrella lausannensis TaxID=483423 RepID=A0A0H5DSR1_9BACT|nr:nicotinate phosphoribosyltransferase [Estrella lausannensis]CRX39358.1 Nicotinate phosphoribosyltransferase [Estrella lausannensis]
MADAHLRKFYSQSLALLTDFYQVTMSYAYWKAGLDKKESVFHLFFRTLPFNGGYAVAAGLESVVEFLDNFRFDESDIAYLSQLKDTDGNPLFEEAFFDFLAGMRFSCDVDAVPEGTTVFPYEPLIRVKGPLIQCQLLESPLLNLFNFPSLIATKAARICMAAKGDSVLEFGLRRAQGIDGALTASRAAYIGGCDSTSNVLAAKLFGIPVKGTHSHSWVMVFDDELESFTTFAKHMPTSCVFLVDTYNTLKGVEKAIEAAKLLRSEGHEMIGIRLDSGDLADLSIKARNMLDASGFPDARIFASNELDETIISELKRQGAKITVWGVGTNLVTGKDQPALDGVYKLSAIRDPGEHWKYKLKLSEQMKKVSNPGILQVRRFKAKGINIADAIYDINSPLDDEVSIVDPFDSTKEARIKNSEEFEDLLIPIYREGRRVYTLPSLHDIRKRTQEQLSSFPVGVKRFLNPHQYMVGMEKSLYDLKIRLVRNIRSEKAHDYIVP